MRTAGVALLVALAAYVAGVLLGVGLVHLGSSQPDRSLEGVMTGLFATGPARAVVAFLVAIVAGRRGRGSLPPPGTGP